jgi:hypothetical protein
MSTNEQNDGAEEKRIYRSPEMVRMGDALELTAGKPDLPLTDGSMKPNGYKDIE